MVAEKIRRRANLVVAKNSSLVQIGRRSIRRLQIWSSAILKCWQKMAVRQNTSGWLDVVVLALLCPGHPKVGAPKQLRLAGVVLAFPNFLSKMRCDASKELRLAGVVLALDRLWPKMGCTKITPARAPRQLGRPNCRVRFRNFFMAQAPRQLGRPNCWGRFRNLFMA